MIVRWSLSYNMRAIINVSSAASWFDHPRDLLHLINLKRDEMPRPIVGIGHSFGAAHLFVLSSLIRSYMQGMSV